MKTLLFTSPTCGPCRQLKKDLESAGISEGITQVDASAPESSSMVSFYGVRSVPTLVFLDDDEEVIKVRVGYTGSITDIQEMFHGDN